MKIINFILAICLFIFNSSVFAQIQLPKYDDGFFTKRYYNRVNAFKKDPIEKGDIVFLGNSITEQGGDWSALLGISHIKNRGISGDITEGLLNRLQEIVLAKPNALFLKIGTNDISRGTSVDSIVKNILILVKYIKQESSITKLFIQSLLPVNDSINLNHPMKKTNEIQKLNQQLQQKAKEYAYTFIDLYSQFADEKQQLKVAYTKDGLHLIPEGYLLWKKILLPYLQNK